MMKVQKLAIEDDGDEGGDMDLKMNVGDKKLIISIFPPNHL